jgi:CRP-like cAMP-binding protein|tara:strand:+ start:441 stop:665 length:225 start_codon:yes stop_codon:yes gene_type:complete
LPLFATFILFVPSNRGSGKKEEVNRHGSGGFFGEGALVNEGNNGGVRNAECVADATTTCYALERDDFQVRATPR